MRLTFDVFGRRMVVEETAEGWAAFYPGNEGKRSSAKIAIPSDLDASCIAQYLDDLLHEFATPDHPTVRVIE